MQQNADRGARALFFAFIVVCLIAAIFALGLISRGGGGLPGGGINTASQGGWSGNGDYGDDDDDDDDD